MEAYEHLLSKLEAIEEHVYVNSFNDDYDNICCIAYYDSRVDPDIAFNFKTVIRKIPFQVRVRDVDFDNGYARIEAIRQLFSNYSYQVIKVRAKGDIQMLGNDEKRRAEFTINFYMDLVEGSTVT